ncbi:MAG: putative Ig domain-containing protein [Shinella sp.]|nr:putative Ig domain-containing protein [Shinella sp.]
MFRYKQAFGDADVNPGNPAVSKDVMAYYIGGVGVPFGEELPLKPEWDDDDWRVVDGSLPNGVTFDPSTRSFVGTPTAETRNLAVHLEGFNTEGRSVASAEAIFNIYAVLGVPVKMDVFAHTGKYKLAEFALRSEVAVDTFETAPDFAAPPGVTFSGRFMEGAPTTAGMWNYMTYGRDYNGNVVATFFGNYVVEDAPVFPLIADKIRDLPNPYNATSLDFDFGPPRIKRSVGDISKVRYYLEIDPESSLPGTVKSNGDSSALRLAGSVRQPYETATIRWKAIDIDGVPGWSNWFEFGSADPNPECRGMGTAPVLNFSTAKSYAVKIGAAAGIKGAVSYDYISGTLPDGLVFDPATATISGQPKMATPSSLFTISVNDTTDGMTTSRTCSYEISAVNGQFSLKDLTPQQAQHVRIGGTFNGVLSVQGGIADFDTAPSDFASWPDFHVATNPSKNAATVAVTGHPQMIGTFSVPFTATNGDGNVTERNVTVISHGPLSAGPVDTIHVKRLAASRTWATVPYDAAAVIPDVTNDSQPSLTLSNVAGLPSGISMNADGAFDGATAAEAGYYGPFDVTISDFSKEKASSGSFGIVVDPRDEIAVASVTPPHFTVDMDTSAWAVPVTPLQPEGARTFRIDYVLNNLSGEAPPSWLSFDEDTGTMRAAAGIPYADRGDHGPFTVTMTDSEGSTVTSDRFMVVVEDWPQPAGHVSKSYMGTVSGDQSAGEAATTIKTDELRSSIDPATVIGGPQAVTFLSATPASPAGLTFDASDGSFSGTPTSAFSGSIAVEYQDARGRRGTLSVSLEVRPYPTVETTQAAYDIPRLSQAELNDPLVQGVQTDGFWSQPVWSVDTTRGPALSPYDLAVDAATGMITGRTMVAAGTTVSGVVLKAESRGANGENLVSWTAPFVIRVTPQVPMSFSYSSAGPAYELRVRKDGTYVPYSSDITAIPRVRGSYVGSLTYSADLSSLPAEASGVTFDQSTGQFSGTPTGLGSWTVPVDVTDAENSTATTSIVISSTLAELMPLALEYSPATLLFEMQPDSNGGYVLTSVEDSVPKTTGFSIAPLSYEATIPASESNKPDFPSTLTFDKATGKFFGGPTAPGIWSVPVTVTDIEGMDADTILTVKSTLAGKVKRSNGGANLVLRRNEPFKTEALAISNEIQPLVFSVKPDDAPATAMAGFDPETGAFTDESYFDDPTTTSYSLTIQATDAHGRDFESAPVVKAQVVPPLEVKIAAASTAISSKQFSPGTRIDVAFKPDIHYPIGEIAYGMRGDVPGTLVLRKYANGKASGYIWTAGSTAYELDIAGNEKVVGYRIGGVPSPMSLVTLADGTVDTLPPAAYFPDDALVFDTKKATLVGIPSRSGTFQANVVAYDDHASAYIRDVPTKEEYNSAVSDPITFTVAPADDLTVANSATAENLSLYGSSPELTTTAVNAAYGKSVSWKMIAGTLPDGIQSTVGASVTYTGSPSLKGTWSGIVWQATDAAGRTEASEPVTMTVGDRVPFGIDAPALVTRAVNVQIAPVVVAKGINPAYGSAAEDSDWTVSVSSLPPGITYVVKDGVVTFSGTPTTVGNYDGVTVTAKDSVGATASQRISFQIVNPSGAITLGVAGLTTRVGVPFGIQATSGNTYGTVKYYSYDIDGDPKTHQAGQYVDQLDIGLLTGLVSGSFSDAGDKTFEVAVTDDTNRVTSRSIVVRVVPDLRLTVPALVQTTQGDVLNRTIETAYRLGTVAYEKGAGNWPEGIELDPVTGEIRGYDTSNATTQNPSANKVVSASGTYAGLKVKATDTYLVSGIRYQQTVYSNPFTLEVAPTPAVPDITNPAKTILGRVDTAITAFVPSVVERGRTTKWGYRGTVFTPSVDLTQYGLSFDTKTGRISGTPTQAFIVRDFTIRVTAANGETDVTTPFWIGVAPKEALSIISTQRTDYSFRLYTDFRSDDLIVQNYIGDLTFTQGTTSRILFDTDSGAWYAPASIQVANWYSGQPMPRVARIADEFGRTLNFTINITITR